MESLSPGPSDREVVAEVNRGNREMFEILVRRYNQRLYRIGMAYLRSHAEAEEAMQNTYVKAFLALGRFGGRSAFSTWLGRIMINESLELHRRRKTAPPPFVPDAADESAPNGVHQITLKEMKALLETSLQDLPRKQRAAYVLREVEKLTTAETAASLGISIADAKISLSRAREALRRRLLLRAETAELFAYPAIFCNRLTAQVMSLVLTTR